MRTYLPPKLPFRSHPSSASSTPSPGCKPIVTDTKRRRYNVVNKLIITHQLYPQQPTGTHTRVPSINPYARFFLLEGEETLGVTF